MRMETARIVLEPFTLADVELFHETNTSAFVRRYLWDNETIKNEVSRQILVEMEKCFADLGWGLWKLMTKDTGEYFGYAGLWRFFDEQQPQLLYAIHEAFTGQGYATEAAQRVVDYAFEKLMFSDLLAAAPT